MNLNTATLRDSYGLNEILAFNFVFLCAISTLVLLIAEIIGSLKGMRILYLTPIVTLIVAVFFGLTNDRRNQKDSPMTRRLLVC